MKRIYNVNLFILIKSMQNIYKFVYNNVNNLIFLLFIIKNTEILI